jgi:16S rRNA (cytosine967-C5)-methyltransferase
VELHGGRSRLLVRNRDRLGLEGLSVVRADARRPPLRAGSFDRVLLDAPCSGLGALRRRPDARWRVDAASVDRLVVLQQEMLDAAITLLRPGGHLVYSVCTLTVAETLGIDEWLAARHPDLVPRAPLDAPWRRHGRGSLLFPQTADTDGMFVLRLASSADAAGPRRG